jgi:hypothetical protein
VRYHIVVHKKQRPAKGTSCVSNIIRVAQIALKNVAKRCVHKKEKIIVKFCFVLKECLLFNALFNASRHELIIILNMTIEALPILSSL